MKSIWIEKEIFKWDAYCSDTEGESPNVLHRTYELWNHAKEILDNYNTSDYCADAISNLHKAIGLRIKMLNTNYCFTKSPFKTKEKKIFKQLEDFEIVRPKLINEIASFRNTIEHEDKLPPPYKVCQEFLEVCWYFLKATDLYALYKPLRVGFVNPKNNSYWVELEVHFENMWITDVSGWLNHTKVIESEHSDFLKVDIDLIKTREEHIRNSIGFSKLGIPNNEDCREVDPDDLFFNGQLNVKNEELIEIIKMYFKALL